MEVGTCDVIIKVTISVSRYSTLIKEIEHCLGQMMSRVSQCWQIHGVIVIAGKVIVFTIQRARIALFFRRLR